MNSKLVISAYSLKVLFSNSLKTQAYTTTRLFQPIVKKLAFYRSNVMLPLQYGANCGFSQSTCGDSKM
jgi:hypothetical protein